MGLFDYLVLQAEAERHDLMCGRALLSELCQVRSKKGGTGMVHTWPLSCFHYCDSTVNPRADPYACMGLLACRCATGALMGVCATELSAVLRSVRGMDLKTVAMRLETGVYQATGM